MPHSTLVRTVVLAATIVLADSPALAAQSAFDTNVRAAPQFVTYRIKTPINETISEFTTPIFLVIPFSPAFTVDVGTSYAWARVQPNGGNSAPTSTIRGLTDTQIRANYSVGTDFVVLTAGLNLPTGRETASLEEQAAAFRIGNDFLAFPISNMGTGFGATAGIAVARPVGSWNLGIGASMRHSTSYEPFVANTGARPRFQPGNEYRARFGVDHPFGTGRFAIGLTYSTFGDDDIGGSIYNTGDRFVGQAGFTNTFRNATVLLNAWNLYRRSGTIFTGERVGPENIANVLLGVGLRTMGGVVEPSIEARSWTQEQLNTSFLGTIGLRYTVDAGGFAITPSAGYTSGRFASAGEDASLSGFRAALAIRVGR